MSKSENILAFEAALKESKELLEKYNAAKKRIIENKEAANDDEVLVKAAAEIGYTLSIAELERVSAEAEELNDDDLAIVAGGARTPCLYNYDCMFLYMTD